MSVSRASAFGLSIVLVLIFWKRYFRQLQEISDTVAEAEWDGSLQNAMANNDTERAALDAKINTGHARQRYLDYLAAAQADGTLDEDQESCILCKCEFTRGYVTPWYVVFKCVCYTISCLLCQCTCVL